jgi:uncharacterized protein
MSHSLKINVVTIPEEGLNFALSEDGKWFKECFPENDHPDFDLRKVDFQCQIIKTSGTIFIKGAISVSLDIDCSRCLEDVNLSVGGDFAYTLVPAKPEIKEDLELTVEELEISYYEDDFVDLQPIICEQIILQIPVKPLCSQDCKGLCLHCGNNLNTAACNCQLEFVDERLAALKNFKIKNNN